MMRKLIKVAPDANNNKYYNLSIVDGKCKAEFGRVGAAPQVAWYPASALEKKYREKLRKGYQDHTHLHVVQDTGEIVVDPKVQDIYRLLTTASSESVKSNYVSGSEGVTQAMIDEAQALLNKLTRVPQGKDDIRQFNDTLVELFQVIPRSMRKVSDYLYDGNHDEIITREQDALDALSGQVSTQVTGTKKLDEALGIHFEPATDNDYRLVRSKLNGYSGTIDKVWKVRNNSTQSVYDRQVSTASNKYQDLLWHGSRNENWFSIVKSGLVLRPTNAVITGKMFGYGLYFADKAQKSANYSSLRGSYWSGGTRDWGLLALYRVHLGSQKKILHHRSEHKTLNKQKIAPHHSVFAQGGADLINNEYIVYDESQSTIEYLIKIV